MKYLGYKKSLTAALIALATVCSSGCGQGTDPWSNMGDPGMAIGPGLRLPLNGQVFAFTPYSSSNPQWGLQGNGIFVGGTTQVFAPGSGYVMIADSGGQTVTIVHNAHIQTKVVGVLPTGLAVGSFVAAGAQIGTIPNALTNNTLNFSVIVDGASVCPLSYLTAAARQQVVANLYATSFNSSPCLQ